MLLNQKLNSEFFLFDLAASFDLIAYTLLLETLSLLPRQYNLFSYKMFFIFALSTDVFLNIFNS